MRRSLLLGPLFALAPALWPAAAADPPPSPPREFRGVWVATVANIDWPSKPGLPSAQQQAELRAIFDKCVELKLNDGAVLRVASLDVMPDELPRGRVVAAYDPRRITVFPR